MGEWYSGVGVVGVRGVAGGMAGWVLEKARRLWECFGCGSLARRVLNVETVRFWCDTKPNLAVLRWEIRIEGL